MRILIVDDDEIALDALSQVLIADGHDVTSTRRGPEVLMNLRNGRYDVVIADWMMPEMDGLELCRRIRSEDFGRYIYTILLTARDTTTDIVEGLSAGADDFLTKPFHPEELRVRVRTAARIRAIDTRDLAIFTLAKLVESRDPETGLHLERIRKYARFLAQDLLEAGSLGTAVTPEYVRLIYLTSPLHDIGKVGIPDSILLKPGRLNDREFEIMKSHTTIGATTLETAAHEFPDVSYLQIAAQIARTHHERFDGTGYPAGLAGADIPLCGRIVAVADVYDALTSKRVYKSPFMHDVARDIVIKSAGTHFDPDVVAAFVRQEQRFCDVQRSISYDQRLSA